MITLDEAIEQEKFKARVDRIKANKRIFNNNDKDEISACNRSAEEHEQRAKWFEELKELKSTSCGYSKEDIELNRNAMYNKAIDDFMEKVELKYLGVHPDELYEKYYPSEICKQIKELAEQLKESNVK